MGGQAGQVGNSAAGALVKGSNSKVQPPAFKGEVIEAAGVTEVQAQGPQQEVSASDTAKNLKFAFGANRVSKPEFSEEQALKANVAWLTFTTAKLPDDAMMA